MSIDKSLRLRGALTRQRNVLTRAQRIAELVQSGKFDGESGDPLGLPKVRVLQAKRKGGKKKEKEKEKEE